MKFNSNNSLSEKCGRAVKFGSITGITLSLTNWLWPLNHILGLFLSTFFTLPRESLLLTKVLIDSHKIQIRGYTGRREVRWRRSKAKNGIKNYVQARASFIFGCCYRISFCELGWEGESEWNPRNCEKAQPEKANKIYFYIQATLKCCTTRVWVGENSWKFSASNKKRKKNYEKFRP